MMPSWRVERRCDLRCLTRLSLGDLWATVLKGQPGSIARERRLDEGAIHGAQLRIAFVALGRPVRAGIVTVQERAKEPEGETDGRLDRFSRVDWDGSKRGFGDGAQVLGISLCLETVLVAHGPGAGGEQEGSLLTVGRDLCDLIRMRVGELAGEIGVAGATDTKTGTREVYVNSGKQTADEAGEWLRTGGCLLHEHSLTKRRKTISQCTSRCEREWRIRIGNGHEHDLIPRLEWPEVRL